MFFRIFTLQGEKLHVFRDFHVLGVEFRVFTFSRGQIHFRGQIPFLRPNDSNGLRPCFSNPNGSPGSERFRVGQRMNLGGHSGATYGTTVQEWKRTTSWNAMLQ